VANELVSFATPLASRFNLPKGADQAGAKANNQQDKAECLRSVRHRCNAEFDECEKSLAVEFFIVASEIYF
jgi:hypothetical protein